MSQFKWFRPLDGFGLLAVDLHECRWFHVQSYDMADGADYGLSYYLTKDGRWIEYNEDEDVVSDQDGHPTFGITQSYDEVHPIKVAHELLSRSYYRKPLPPQLEPFREYGDSQRYTQWLWDESRRQGEAGSARLKPNRCRLPQPGAEGKQVTPHRILSPVRLPFSWYWKQVAVVLKVCESKARTSPPWCFRIVAAWG
jgi:hypothetical protein